MATATIGVPGYLDRYYEEACCGFYQIDGLLSWIIGIAIESHPSYLRQLSLRLDSSLAGIMQG